jgi:hypothetical protein
MVRTDMIKTFMSLCHNDIIIPNNETAIEKPLDISSVKHCQCNTNEPLIDCNTNALVKTFHFLRLLLYRYNVRSETSEIKTMNKNQSIV